MPIYHRVTDPTSTVPVQQVRLDERFITFFLPQDAQTRLEAQELRQIVHQALQQLTADEFRVIELRYQHKKSPGQVASQMGLSRRKMQELEASGLDKIRRILKDWYSES
jgi:RNA polymerase sigma factor (sigma-70 family)